MEKVSTFKRAVNPKVRTHIWVVVHVGETEDWSDGSLCPLCGGSPPPPWKGQTLMRSTQLNCDQQTPPHLPLPAIREAGYLYCWFFSWNHPPPRDPWKKMFIAYFRHWWWWLKNWLWTVQQHTMKWYYRIIEGEKLLLLLLRVGQSFSLVIGDWISLLT